MSDYQTLLSNFEALGLNNMREYYPVLLDKVHTEDMSLTSAFLEITDKEKRRWSVRFTAHAFLK